MQQKTINVELSAGDSFIRDGVRYTVINPANPAIVNEHHLYSANYIIDTCEKYFDVGSLFDNLDKKSYSLYRNVCYFLLRKYTTLTTLAIGRMFGKTHSTIILICNKMNELMKYDSELARHINNLIELIEADTNNIKYRIL